MIFSNATTKRTVSSTKWDSGQSFEKHTSVSEKPVGVDKYGTCYEGISGQGFAIHNDMYSVSWKAGEQDRARFNMEFEHHSPRHDTIRVSASESYFTENGRLMSREVMDSLTIEQAEILAKYLTGCVEAHKANKSQEAA